MGYPVIGLSDWDDATLTASESAAAFPATNLQRQGTSYRWETPDALGIKSLTWSSPNRRSVSLVGLMHHNGTARGTFRARFANDDVSEIDANPVQDTAPWGPAWWASNVESPGSGLASNGGWTAATRTVECWFLPEHDGVQGILRIEGGTNRPTLAVNVLGKIEWKDTPTGTTVLTSTTGVVAGEWIHLAATFNDTTNAATLIVNGVQEASGTAATWDLGTQLRVSPTVVESMSGKINEIRYWNIVRTAAQVSADMGSQLVGTETGLLGVWGSEAPIDGSLTNRKAGGPALVMTPATQFAFDSVVHRTSLWATPDLHHLKWRDGFYHNPVGISCQFVKIDFLDGTNPEGKFRMARAPLSEAMQWPRGFGVESDFYSGVSAGFSRDTKADYVKRFRTFDQELYYAEWLRELHERAGETRDVIAIGDPEATTRGDLNLVLGRFQPNLNMRWHYRESRGYVDVSANLHLTAL